jgi:uridine phosphorylase
MSDLTLPLLGIKARDVPQRVVVVGDPARAAKVAEQMDGVDNLANSREYSSFRGTYDGKTVMVVSHGVGAAGAAVCFEELLRGGAQTLIRAGTAGALQDHIADGSLVIATGAVRDEGLTHRLVPETFPAVSDPDVLVALRDAVIGVGYEAQCGIFLTSDLFYPHKPLGSQLSMWSSAGVIATEMEASALLVLASLHGCRAGSVAVIDGNPLRRDDQKNTSYNPHRDIVDTAVAAMIEAALVAVTSAPVG